MAGWMDLGKVMALPKGEYDPEVTYEINDYVTFSRGGFVCRKSCKGVAPVVGQTTEYWQDFGSAVKPATSTEAGIVIPDVNSFTVDSDGRIKPNIDVLYNKNTKYLNIVDAYGNKIGSGTLIESSGAADVEWVESESKLYLIDSDGKHIGNGAHLSISGGAGVLEVDWETYLAAKETYDAMDMIILCPDAPGELTAKVVSYKNTNVEEALDELYDRKTDALHTEYDNTESELEAENVQDAIDETAKLIGKVQEDISSLNENLIENTYEVATTDWVANIDAGTDTDYYTYKADVTASGVISTSPFHWHLNGSGVIPTEAETESINMVLEAVSNTNKITLYATDKPTVALVLAMVGGR